MRRISGKLGVSLLALTPLQAQALECRSIASGVFAPQNKPVSLIGGTGAAATARAVYFRAGLRVNTDGAPNSYHPEDPRGATKAINNIANGISITRDGKALKYKDTIRVFEQWRDAGWVVPDGYRITWKNVLAAREVNGHSVPCTFSSGPFTGYFVSLTALKQGLAAGAAGECRANDQLDERVIPALVLAGGNTPMKQWGVRVGDLVVTRNKSNGATVAAVVGDTGPNDNLGEGSVALNMSLLRRTQQPGNYEESKQLDTGATQIDVLIFPRSAAFEWKSPLTAETIKTRVEDWLKAQHLDPLDSVAETIAACAP